MAVSFCFWFCFNLRLGNPSDRVASSRDHPHRYLLAPVPSSVPAPVRELPQYVSCLFTIHADVGPFVLRRLRLSADQSACIFAVL